MATAKTVATKPTPAEEKHEEKPVVVVDIGKQKRKRVRRLRKGRGRLVHKINDLVSDMKSDETLSADAQTVVIVVREKRRRRLRRMF